MKTVTLTKLQASQIIGNAFPIADAPKEWKRLESPGLRQADIGASFLVKEPQFSGSPIWRLTGDGDDVEYWLGLTF